jgi:peptidoglycan hydrolase CwlO-like protein
MKTIIKKIKEYNRKMMGQVKKTREELQDDVKIEISSNYRIEGDKEENKDMLATLEIYSYTITPEELEVLLEALKCVYSNHPDGEIKMSVTHNHEYLNC